MYMGAPACHSWAMLRMINAQSNVIDPAGNIVSSAKYVDDTRSIASGVTLHECVFKTTPSSCRPEAVAE